jgi:hypothetical protein
MHYFFLACLLACAPYHANNGMICSRPAIFVLIFVAVVLMLTEMGEISALSQQQHGRGGEVNTDDNKNPPPLSHDEIEFLKSLDYLERDDVESAYAVLERNFMDSARNPDPEKRINRLSQRKISLGGGTTFTSEYKLRADLEQARYLAETLYDNERGDRQKAEFFASVVVPVYETVSTVQLYKSNLLTLFLRIKNPCQHKNTFTHNNIDCCRIYNFTISIYLFV